MSTPALEQLSCQELVELLTAYLEGALPAAEHARAEEHLAACTGCGTYLEQMRQTIRVTGALRTADLDPPAEEALLEAFRGWRVGV